MWRPWWPGAALCAWALLVACGEDSGGDDAGTGGSAGSAGATSGLPPGTRAVLPVESPRAGECMSSADCSGGGLPGTACATVAGSYKVCAFQTPEATVATNPAGQCDPSRPCATGKCYPVLTFPTGQCGGAGARNVNTCVADECASDADCPEGVCGPRGLTVKEGTPAEPFVSVSKRRANRARNVRPARAACARWFRPTAHPVPEAR